MRKRRLLVCGAMAALVVAGPLPTASAEEEKETGWTDTAEFSFVLTQGNSESSTLGFKNTLARAWDRSSFTLRAGGIRVETSDETTAESYFLNGRYDRKITDRFFWYAGAGWDRNRFAGIDNRYTGVGGVGNIWYDRDDLKFRTDYAVTFTRQEDTSGLEDDFPGLRFSWDYLNKLTETATYTNTLVIDENLDETSDWRADMINSLAVSMSERLALKVSLQWLYDNEPSLDDLGIPFDELDTIFTVSLVVNF